jgi:pantetheine-phosphate adenylyltransferase
MIALYPGSFDPFTYGHLDILERAASLFNKVVVTVAVNTRKASVFTADERVEMIRECIKDKPWAGRVEVNHFTGLLVNHANEVGAHTLIRGVRQVSDFEYEFRMALMNRRLAPTVDTVFLMPREELTFVSATLVKEVAYWGGDLTHFLPDSIARKLLDRVRKEDASD